MASRAVLNARTTAKAPPGNLREAEFAGKEGASVPPCPNRGWHAKAESGPVAVGATTPMSADADRHERHGVITEDVDDFDGDGVPAGLGVGVEGDFSSRSRS